MQDIFPNTVNTSFGRLTKSHEDAEGSGDHHEVQVRPEADARAEVMLIQNLTLRISIVLDVPLGVAR